MANGKQLLALDELKMLCGSDYGVNDQQKETEEDVYYCVNHLSEENLETLENQYHYVRCED